MTLEILDASEKELRTEATRNLLAAAAAVRAHLLPNGVVVLTDENEH